MYSWFVLCSFAKSCSSARWQVRMVSRSVARSSAVLWTAARWRARVTFCPFDKEGRERTWDVCWSLEGLRPAWVEGFSSGGVSNGDADREAMTVTAEWVAQGGCKECVQSEAHHVLFVEQSTMPMIASRHSSPLNHCTTMHSKLSFRYISLH